MTQLLKAMNKVELTISEETLTQVLEASDYSMTDKYAYYKTI